MQVKVFESEDMASALKKVKKTLGPDALILSTRTVRKGKLGFLGKPILEVTAAVEPPVSETVRETVRGQTPSAFRSFPLVQDEPTYEDIWRKREVADSLAEEVKDLREKLGANDFQSIRGEIDELRQLVQDFAKGMSDSSKGASAHRYAAPLVDKNGEDDCLAPVMAELTRRGIEAEAAETIARFAAEKLSPQQVYNLGVLDGFLEDTVADLLQVSGPILPTGKGPRRVALIGPTGVGKTTTIAKLAADFLLNHGKKVALVTIDTYRIAAVEQLKVYGEIMNLPVEVVMTPEQLNKAFDRHQDKELILIDTAGRSPKDEVSLKELMAFLHPDFGTENHLVLSATTREQDLYEAVRRFCRIPIQSLIFTKLDECESLGVLLNVHVRDNHPLSYLTNGQKVPEDLILADPKKIAGLIVGKQ
jgi:flagellar biosynthesis protein FlhF